MAHTGVFATSAQCVAKMGKGYDSTNVDETMINGFCDEIEGFCCALAKYDLVTNWASLDAESKQILTEIETNYCGFFGAMYSSEGYESQREQENIMNTCWARFVHCIGLIKDQKVITYIKTGD